MKRTPVLGIALFAMAPILTGARVVFAGAPSAASPAANVAPAQRPPEWATPVARPGLPNLHKVTDTLYRGAQPTAEGMRELKKLGIKTVINLRALHDDRDELGDLDLKYVEIEMNAWSPEEEDVIRFLRAVTNPANEPVFLHCQHGADRTGMMTAVYRIVVQGWSRDAAIEEMTKGGFGYHTVWKDIVAYLRTFDVEAVRKKAGLTP